MIISNTFEDTEIVLPFGSLQESKRPTCIFTIELKRSEKVTAALHAELDGMMIGRIVGGRGPGSASKCDDVAFRREPLFEISSPCAVLHTNCPTTPRLEEVIE